MFIGGTGSGVRENKTDELFAVHCSTPQYWAWRDWFKEQKLYGMRFVSKWLTVYSEWPPMTQVAADNVAARISAQRDEMGIAAPVPRHPVPWSGVPPEVPEDYRNVMP